MYMFIGEFCAVTRLGAGMGERLERVSQRMKTFDFPLLSSPGCPLVEMLKNRKQTKTGQTGSQLADIYLVITREGSKMGEGRKFLCGCR
jgi:hypothetical protein